MDPICEEIDSLVKANNYRQLYTYDDQSIQVYFDNLCMKGETVIVDILLKLFPNISPSNALIYTYTMNNKKLFEIICRNLTPNFKENNPNFLNSMLLNSYDYHKGDKDKFILRELLQMLVHFAKFSCDDIFANAVQARIMPLAEIVIKYVSAETIVSSFEKSYKSGNYRIAKITYDRICLNRLAVDRNLGYCPSGAIIEMVSFQEFYKWEDQFNASVEDHNYYALESLIKKMPTLQSLPLTMLKPAISHCPDSLLFAIVNKFSIPGLTHEQVKEINRIPIYDYYENKVLDNDWLLIKNNIF